MDCAKEPIGCLLWMDDVALISNDPKELQCGRRSPAVACWASDHWVASSNPLRGMFRH